MLTIPEMCPKCDAPIDEGTCGATWTCGSYPRAGARYRNRKPSIYQTDLCSAREEIAALKAQLAETSHTDERPATDYMLGESEARETVQRHRAEKAEAERDEARRVARLAAEALEIVSWPHASLETIRAVASEIHAALPEWAKEVK